MRKIRHWLKLPLLTRRELRMLNDFWWEAATKDFPTMIIEDNAKNKIPVADKMAVSQVLEEFGDAIEWIEEMKA